ncbi:MAG: DNA starvation/stationary phase protection protein [Myxococcales bacterium]|nr:DNA starvation/stationary phase protection protein [Myxococcales bacterium]MCB9665788.1 DNA starvation/stationary phase protection protein [Alphaproteobacteria bacterium]
MKIDIGLDEEARAAVVTRLERVLADTYTLYLLTHSFHWNVTGPKFNDLHAMFMGQYTEMWAAVDEVAERIRALGAFAPGSYGAFARLTSIESPEDVPEALEMVRQLVLGHEALIRTARGALVTAEEARDQVTADLLTQRLQVHEKTAWMLRSLLA